MCLFVCCNLFFNESHPTLFLAAGHPSGVLAVFGGAGELDPVSQFPVFLMDRSGIAVIGPVQNCSNPAQSRILGAVQSF